MIQSRVAVVHTSPQSVFDDYGRLLRLVPYTDSILKERDTVLDVDLSWHHFTPCCSSPPWQIDGVLKTLIGDGFPRDSLTVCLGARRGIASTKGQILNRHLQAAEHHSVTVRHLSHEGAWIQYEPKAQLRVLHKVFPGGILLPDIRMGKNTIHLATMKTDVLSTVAGAVYTCFEGLLNVHKTDAYCLLHDAFVDALAIEREISPGIIAIMDGVIAGEGSCPRCPVPHEKNIILASSDPVALDAVAASLMGFNPLSVPFIRLAHEAGLGVGDVKEIEILGDGLPDGHFGFRIDDRSMGASLRRGEATRNGKSFSVIHSLMSFIYHDIYWFYAMREDIVREFKKGEWGKLFESYRRSVNSEV